MRVLAIDCATEACSVALFEDGKLLDARHEVLGRGHAERLVPMIADLPGNGRAAVIRVSLGPGSFTGTRIGIAAGRALGVAWGAAVVGYPTLSLVAAMAREHCGSSAVLAAMAGGHGEFFVQQYTADGMPLDEHRSLAPQIAASHSEISIVAGSKAEELVALRGFGEAIPILPDASKTDLLAESAYRDDLSPIYGRPPDARIPA